MSAAALDIKDTPISLTAPAEDVIDATEKKVEEKKEGEKDEECKEEGEKKEEKKNEKEEEKKGDMEGRKEEEDRQEDKEDEQKEKEVQKEAVKAPADVPKPQAPPMFKKKPPITSYPYTEEVDVRYLRRLPIPMASYPHINWRGALNGYDGVSPLTLIERETGAAILIRKNGLGNVTAAAGEAGKVLVAPSAPQSGEKDKKDNQKKELPLLGGDATGKSPNVSNVALPPTAPASPTFDKGGVGIVPVPKSSNGQNELNAINPLPTTPARLPAASGPHDALPTSGKEEEMASKPPPAADNRPNTQFPATSTPAEGVALATKALEMTALDDKPKPSPDFMALKGPILEVIKELSGDADLNIDLNDEAQFEEVLKLLTEKRRLDAEWSGVNKFPGTAALQKLFGDLPGLSSTPIPAPVPPIRTTPTPVERAYNDLLERHLNERLQLINSIDMSAARPANALDDLDEQLIQMIEVQQVERRRAKAAIDSYTDDVGLHFLVLAQHSEEAENCIAKLRHLLDIIIEEEEDGWTTSDDGDGGVNMIPEGNKAEEKDEQGEKDKTETKDVKGDKSDLPAEVEHTVEALGDPLKMGQGKMSAVIEERPSAVAAAAEGGSGNNPVAVEVAKAQDLKSVKDGIEGHTQMHGVERDGGAVEVQVE